MPDASLLAAGAGSVPSPTDFFNSFSTMFTNYQNQRFSKQMYGRQFDDSIKLWNMQNVYNSPESQMQRFRDAGLNPNLIYGQGNSGNAGSIPTPDVSPVNFREPRFEGGRPDVMANLLAQADLRIKGAQADNLQVQNEVLRHDAYLRRFQGLRAEFDYAFERGLEGTSADARRESLRRLTTEIDLAMNKDAREAALNASNVTEAAQRMLTLIEQRKGLPLERLRTAADTARIRESINQMHKDGILKDLDIELRRAGINPNDPLWARIVGRFLDDIMGSDVKKGLKDLMPTPLPGRPFGRY